MPEFTYGRPMLGLHQKNHKTACIRFHIVTELSPVIYITSSVAAALQCVLRILWLLHNKLGQTSIGCFNENRKLGDPGKFLPLLLRKALKNGISSDLPRSPPLL